MDFEKRLKEIVRPMKRELDKKDKERGKIFPLSRAIIDKSKKGALLLHQGKLVEGGNLLQQAKTMNEGLQEILKEYPILYYTGIHDAQKELTEGMIFFSILSNMEIPGPEDIGVEYPAYLNGLGEAVGELKRRVGDCLIKKDMEGALKTFNLMEKIFFVLMDFTQHDKVNGHLRHTLDMVRGVTEKARGRLTGVVLKEQSREEMKPLVEEMKRLIDGIKQK